MADSSESRTYGRGAVVRPLSRAAGRPCARPGCPSPARATLGFAYGTREARLGPLAENPSPQTYDLCSGHADRTSPPHGWSLHDDRPADDLDEGPAAGELGGERTVAVLAAALRSSPPPPDAAEDDEDPLREALEELQAVAAGAFDDHGSPDGVGSSEAADAAGGDRSVARFRQPAVLRPRPVLAARREDATPSGVSRPARPGGDELADAAVLAEAVAEVRTSLAASHEHSERSSARDAGAAVDESQATLW